MYKYATGVLKYFVSEVEIHIYKFILSMDLISSAKCKNKLLFSHRVKTDDVLYTVPTTAIYVWN